MKHAPVLPLKFGAWNFSSLRRTGGPCPTHTGSALERLRFANSAEASAPPTGAWILGFGAFILLLLSTMLTRSADSPKSPPLDLKPGDHVVLIGNALADRFQHSGWLETF